MPLWVRIWYMVPLIDRYAYEWLWWHGGFGIPVERDDFQGPDAATREPRRPSPRGPAESVRRQPSN